MPAGVPGEGCSRVVPAALSRMGVRLEWEDTDVPQYADDRQREHHRSHDARPRHQENTLRVPTDRCQLNVPLHSDRGGNRSCKRFVRALRMPR